ncbi:ABC transporter permease [Candidatus Methylomirabilis sp.]|uniref:ABC transporter permease n=1 Tax=Candidatus Methylomirabilis sp. TaxID=2032687 RepID=UPI002A689D76|nr:ABC transporter permease [Candidatus Methylomirabilis sp.]
MNKPLAFLKRDLLIEASYRFSFLIQIVSVLFSIASYYFLARFIGGWAVPGLDVYGGDYFTFVLVGVALHDYLATSLDAFSRSIRESQLAGTLEALMSTQTSVPTIILLSAAYPFLWTSLTVVLYLALGVGLFGVRLSSGNWAAAALILMLGVVVFSALGILSASFIMVFKRGSPIAWLLGGLSWLLGGVLYPVTILPDWLRRISALMPITYAIEGMRAALLRAAPWSEVWPSVIPLLLFAFALLPLSLLSFQYATRYSRIAGTLHQY